MRAWERSEDVLFDAAMQNLAFEAPAELQLIHGPEDVPITVAESPSYYNASRALLLERDVVPEGHPYGALVTIPNRHVFFYHLIEDARVILAVNALVSLSVEAYRRGPGSISHHVFWTRKGALHRIPCEVEGGSLHVSPPPIFVKEVLDRLRAPPS